MAELIGTIASVVTLAALFNSCVEAFDAFQTARNHGVDLKKLTLKLNIEKCRLYIWGQAMGLTSATTKKRKPLDICPYPELVHQTLELIIQTLGDSTKLKDKYGCRSVSPQDVQASLTGGSASVLQQLNASFDHFKIKSQNHAKQTARKSYWVIHDRKKFEALICEAKDLIDGLQDITKDIQSRAVQLEMMSSRIRHIDDVRTLDWVSEVCEVDYPELSDVASTEAESLSESRTLHRDVQDWKDTVPPGATDDDSDGSSVETTLAALEDMTMTEVKHKLSFFLLRAKAARQQATEGAGHEEDAEPAESPSPAQPTPAQPTLFQSRNVTLGAFADPETDAYQTILNSMAEASLDTEFIDELKAIMTWFEVLSSSERSVAFYRLGEHLKVDADQTRFFAQIQAHRASLLPPLSAAKKLAADPVTPLVAKSVATVANSDILDLDSSIVAASSATASASTGPSKSTNTAKPLANSKLLASDTVFESMVSNAFKDFARSQRNDFIGMKAQELKLRREKEYTKLRQFSQNFQLKPLKE